MTESSPIHHKLRITLNQALFGPRECVRVGGSVGLDNLPMRLLMGPVEKLAVGKRTGRRCGMSFPRGASASDVRWASEIPGLLRFLWLQRAPQAMYLGPEFRSASET